MQRGERGQPMYQSIVLAFDGSVEGRVALREGADLAVSCSARTYLVAVLEPPAGIALVEGIYPVEVLEQGQEEVHRVIETGVGILRYRGLQAEGRLGIGDPAEQISRISRDVAADLVVVGHRRCSPLARWWRGSLGRSLLDALDCSLLVVMASTSTPEDFFE